MSGGLGGFSSFGATSVTEPEVGGSATFNGLSINTAGSYTLSASDALDSLGAGFGLISFNSHPFNVAASSAPGKLLNLQFSDNTSTQNGAAVLSGSGGIWNSINLATFGPGMLGGLFGASGPLNYSDGSPANAATGSGSIRVLASGQSISGIQPGFEPLLETGLIGHSGNIAITGLSSTATYEVVIYSGNIQTAVQVGGGVQQFTSAQSVPGFPLSVITQYVDLKMFPPAPAT